jgi:hypothetical protein
MNTLTRISLIIILVAFVVAGLIVGHGSKSPRNFLGGSIVRAQEDSCSIASLHGTYAVHAHGTIVGQLPQPPFPTAPFPFGEAGIVTLNGTGQLSGKTTVNLGGVVLQPTFSGMYTVNSDCTGTLTVQSSAGFVLHDAIIVTRGGGGTVEVQTDPFAVVTRTLERIAD